MQTLNFLRNRHEWAPVDIQRHFEDISETQLAAGSTTKAVDLTALCQNHSMHVTTRGVSQLEKLQGLIIHTRTYSIKNGEEE